MNPKLYLALSLLANAVLGFYAFRPAPPAAAPVSTPAPGAATPAKPAAAAPRTVIQTVTNTVARKFNWEAVESPDYKEYIANLRSVGCPQETIRDIILADVGKLYDQKRKELRGAPQRFEYWKAGNPFFAAAGTPELQQKLTAIEEEKTAFLRSLGIEPDFKTQAAAMFNPLEAMLDFVPEAKRTQMLKLFSDQQNRMAKAMKDGQPEPEQMQKAQKEMNDAVKQLLTPEEYLDYQLRLSPTANTMRSQIGGFDPSEQEFMTVFKLRQGFDEEFSMFGRGNESDAERKRREEAQKQLDEQTKLALGEARYEDYKRSQDWVFQQIHRAAKRADLGTTEAVQVFEMKKVAEKQAREVQSNQALTSEQRQTALAGIQQETERAVQRTLGEKGWEHYNRQNNTSWLRNLNPKRNDVPRPAVP